MAAKHKRRKRLTGEAATFQAQHDWLQAEGRKHSAVRCPNDPAGQLEWAKRAHELKCRVAQLRREYLVWFRNHFPKAT